MVYLAENLKYLRSKARASQATFSKQIGVSRASLSSYENKTSEPPILALIKICQNLSVSMDEMLNEDMSLKGIFPSQEKVGSTQAWLDNGNRI